MRWPKLACRASSGRSARRLHTLAAPRALRGRRRRRLVCRARRKWPARLEIVSDIRSSFERSLTAKLSRMAASIPRSRLRMVARDTLRCAWSSPVGLRSFAACSKTAVRRAMVSRVRSEKKRSMTHLAKPQLVAAPSHPLAPQSDKSLRSD